MENSNEVVIVDIKMPFWSMVAFMVKWAIACIPALIILMIIGAFVFGVLRDCVR
jgi:CHASE2 domain-containing sensor protein